MKISRVQPAKLSADKVQGLTGDSFFASPGFMELWRPMGGEPVFWVARHDEDIVALMPGVEFGHRPLKRFQSMPDGCYGCIFFSYHHPADNRATSRLLAHELAKAGYAKTFIHDYDGCFDGVVGYRKRECMTLVADIRSADWVPPDKKIQSEIRKAEREEVSYCAFDAERHMEKFLSLMTATEKRHSRRPRYSREFFEALAILAEKDDRVIWWWCERDEQPVTSHINFIERDMVLNWQVYYDKAFSHLKANQYLLCRLAQESAKRGIKKLNLGGSPFDAGGLTEYKEKWGSKPHHYKCYFLKSGLGKLL
ncbi:MAG: GNAT family N-acetyltransferase [Candidatus Zixiibacteriota bacterium]